MSNDPMLEGLSDIEKLAHESINEWYVNKTGKVSAEDEVRCMTFNQFYNRLVYFGRKIAGMEFENGYRRGQEATKAELDTAVRALADTKQMLNDQTACRERERDRAL